MRFLNLWVLACCIAACIAINVVMGKDMNSDMLAYHVYSAHMFWTGGYRSEFMGAGLQSFFNPMGYLPFYWMLEAGWPSLLIASCMATVHALNLFMIWMIGKNFLFRDTEQRLALSALGVLLASVSPVFVALVGSSFLDPTQSALMLGGVYFLMRGLQPAEIVKNKSADLVLGGLLLGAATGLKPTIVATPVFAMIGLVIVSWRYSSFNAAVQRAIPFGVAGIAGGLLTGGFWAWHLWQRFGSPVFPFANDVFKSPDFYPVPLTTDRFIATGITDLLAFPFRMAKINSGIYVEIAAPDLRFALIVLAALGLLILKLRSKLFAANKSGHPSSQPAIVLLWILFACVVMIWMAKLGNGRYHVMYLLLAGPLLLWLLTKIWSARRSALLVGCLILVAQFAHALSMGYPRWDSGSWTQDWVRTSWPSSLPRTPAVWVQVEAGVDTFVFSKFPPGSKFVDLGSKFPVSPDGPLAPKIKDTLSGVSIPKYVIFKGRASIQKALHEPRELSDGAVKQLNHLLAPWELSLGSSVCSPIEIELDREEVSSTDRPNVLLASRSYALLACPLQSGGMHDAEEESTRDVMREAARSLSTTCPKLFPAPASYPTRSGSVWMTRFIGTDTVVALSEGRMTYSRFPFGPFNVPIEFDANKREAKASCAKAIPIW